MQLWSAAEFKVACLSAPGSSAACQAVGGASSWSVPCSFIHSLRLWPGPSCSLTLGAKIWLAGLCTKAFVPWLTFLGWVEAAAKTREVSCGMEGCWICFPYSSGLVSHLSPWFFSSWSGWRYALMWASFVSFKPMLACLHSVVVSPQTPLLPSVTPLLPHMSTILLARFSESNL